MREQQVLAQIRRVIVDCGEEALSVLELGAALGWHSAASAAYHRKSLEQRGALVRPWLLIFSRMVWPPPSGAELLWSGIMLVVGERGEGRIR
jgi:hypothetical protein